MNSDEYKLKIIVTYNGKSFNKESMNVISLEEIKNLSIENFKLSKEDINFMKFSCLNNKESNCFIESDIDIFNNISKKDSENYEIKLKLSIDKSDLNITKKISDNMLEIINDYEKDGEISINFSKIKDLKEKDESYKKIIKIFRDKYNEYKKKYSVLKKIEEEKKKERINRVIINDELLEKIIKTNKIIENIEKYKKFENDCLFLNKKFEEKYKNLENEALKIKKKILENNEKLKQLEIENSKLKQENEELNKINQNMLQNILSENRENFQNLKNENIEIKNYFEEMKKELKNNNNEIISQIKSFVKKQMENIIKEEFKKEEEIKKRNNVDKNLGSILNKQNNDIFKELTIIKDIIENNNKKEISTNHNEKNANININNYNNKNNLLNNNSEKKEELNNFNDNNNNKITKNISNINVNTNINNNNNISKIKSNCINNDNNKVNNTLNNNTCEKSIEINNDVINEKKIINQIVEKSKINTLEKTGETEENNIDHQFKLIDNNNMNDGGSKIIINYNNTTKLNSDNFSVLDNNIYNLNKGNNDKKEDSKKINSINNDNNDNNDKENSENLLNEMKSIFNSELKYYSDEEIINALNNNKNNIRLALTELMIINPKNDG